MRYAATTFLVLLAVSFMQGQTLPHLSGEAILKNVEANFAGIQDYTVSLEAKVDLERLKVPQMKATMYFKQPDKVHFDSEGFALLPKEGLSFSPGSLSSRYDVEAVKAENEVFVLTLKPKTRKTNARMLVTVRPVNWTVLGISSMQQGGRSIQTEFEYEKLEGYWLPVRLTATLTVDTSEASTSDDVQQRRPSFAPRQGTIQIRYSDYRINSGLPDEIFEKKDQDR
ncbi:MAG: hypothetical protein KF749_09195 [Bacteroidetes bacterium]|nr:hypothetical protein [Bacteroidota bacterium]MCW5894800.1 hypothetical protein [Bacteroidota bacterium]